MLIWRTPCVELMAAGKNAPSPIMNTAGALPMPKKTSDSGTQAVTGMLRSTWMVGARTRSDHPGAAQHPGHGLGAAVARFLRHRQCAGRVHDRAWRILPGSHQLHTWRAPDQHHALQG